ncbi:MAG: sodium-dependent transporter [Phycisphaerae bacterium]
MERPKKENWGSKFGVVLAVSGSAVGLGNFLRFPGTAVNNGGGAFMIPYIISLIVLGIPIAWCEWTIGRLGGHRGQNNGPGIMYALSRNALGRITGTLTLVIPVAVYMYYVLLEALCLRYSWEFFSGGFSRLFADAANNDTSVTGAAVDFAVEAFGIGADGAMYGTAMLWLVLACFMVNFVIIYRGVTRGIEKFCIAAMPLLILCALIVLLRVLTLTEEVDGRTIGHGLGFMWNPDWTALKNPEVWLRAAGQIFFSLSVGFGLILCYSSYLRRNDDVVLTSLTASSTNEFCEVILGGLIVVPAAILFLGPGNTPDSTFALGFFTVPAVMHYMPGGAFFGGMWFGLLFLAAVTSSISMLQPAIAFLEDGFGMTRRVSVTVLGVVTLFGAGLVMYYSENVQALDFTDFWCEFMMILAALGQVVIFGWIIGAKKGVEEANRGADFRIPGFMPTVIRYVTPTFLIVVLGLWLFYNAPTRLDGMSPGLQGERAARGVYAEKIGEQFPELADDEDALEAKVVAILGVAEGVPASRDGLPGWLRGLDAEADKARASATKNANVARFVFLGVVLFFIGVFAVSDIACRGRIRRMLEAGQEASA